jgi:hypothetical protein
MNPDLKHCGQQMSKAEVNFLSKKLKFFSAVNFFYFWSSQPWNRIGIQPKMLDPDLDTDGLNKSVSEHCGQLSKAEVDHRTFEPL